MKKTYSLKKPKEFQKVLNKGIWFGGNLVSIYILSNKLNKNLLGLAIGKKVGKANKRNRVKRVIRAAYKTFENDIEIGYTIVFVWRSKAKFEDLKFNIMKKDIEKSFVKAGLLK